MAHVTFVPGIGNKPASDDLLREWKIALSDNDVVNLDALGATTSMLYWADMLYAGSVPEQTAQEASPLEVEGIVDAKDADMRWLDDVPADERAIVEALGRKVGLAEVSATTDETAVDPIEEGTPLEAVPLPPWLKKRLMRVMLRDVHHYLYDADFSPRPGETYKIRTDIRTRMLKALNEADHQPGPHILFGHSLGTVIAYDAPWTLQDGWPSQRLGDHAWSYVFDALDPVRGFLDREIAAHYRRAGRPRVADVGVSSDGYWRQSIGKHLNQPDTRSIIAQILR